MFSLFQRYLDTFRGLRRDVWLLSLVMLINRSGAMVLPFLTIFLTEERGYTLAQAGLVMSSFGVGSLLGNFLGGWLTDKWSYLKVQILSLWLAGAMWLVMLTTVELWQVCVAVFFTSLFADIFRPANMTAFELHGVPENRTRALSLNRLAINLGFSIGPAAAGFLIPSIGFDSLFIIDALTCWGASLVLIFGIKEKARVKPAPVAAEAGSPARTLLSPYRDSRFHLYLVGQMLVAMAFMQVFSTIPVFWKEVVHLTEAGIGLLMALNGMIVVIFEMPLIHSLQNKRSPAYWIQAGALLIVAGYGALVLGNAMVWSILYIVLISFGEILNFPFGSSYALSIASPEYRGRYMGLYAMTWSVSFIVAPSSGSYLADHFGFPFMAGCMALLALVGVGLLTLSARYERSRTAFG